MGLDMYLWAERSFEPDSHEAKMVLAAAGLSLDQLKERCADPDDPEVYLSRWKHLRERGGEAQAEVERSDRVLIAAGLLPGFENDEANSGRLTFRDGKVLVSLTAAYWRKANAIHAWFVDHVNDGKDECVPSRPIDGEELARLRSLCLEALAAYLEGDLAKAEEILTPRSGFFFGATDIDEWWAEDLKYTVAAIERCIEAAIKVGGVTFRYYPSW